MQGSGQFRDLAALSLGKELRYLSDKAVWVLQAVWAFWRIGLLPLPEIECRSFGRQHVIFHCLLSQITLDEIQTYVVGSKSFRPDQLFKVTEIKQLCYFST